MNRRIAMALGGLAALWTAWPSGILAQMTTPPPPAQPESTWCVKPKDTTRVESFTVTIPGERQAAFDLVVRAFAESNHPVTESSPAVVRWTDVERNNPLGFVYTQELIANLFGSAVGTTVRVSGRERIEFPRNPRSGPAMKVVSSQSNGRALRTWCVARSLADSLTAWSRRPASANGDPK